MTDETNVTAASENTGEYVPEETSTEATSAEGATASAETTSDASQDASASTAVDAVSDGAGNSAEDATVTPDANASRTGFVSNGKAGDECTCPDGRKGTVHKFDEGLICIPNHDQG